MILGLDFKLVYQKRQVCYLLYIMTLVNSIKCNRTYMCDKGCKLNSIWT